MIKLMHTIVVFAHPFDFHEFAEADRTANLVMWRKTMVVSGDDPGTKIVIERETEMHGRKRREEAVRGRKNARSTFSITEFMCKTISSNYFQRLLANADPVIAVEVVQRNGADHRVNAKRKPVAL